MRIINILGINFPLYQKQEAIDLLTEKMKEKNGVGVSILDMSAMNIAYESISFRKALEDNFIILNDGIGLQFAAWLKRTSFPSNLNGTDLIPEFLKQSPKKTTVYLIGSTDAVVRRSSNYLRETHPNIDIIGVHSGFFSPLEEENLLHDLQKKSPDLILVGMGNPQQVFFIQKYKSQIPSLWIAVGGLFDFWGGNRKRAPLFFRCCKLEWLHIMYEQPHKILRYLKGIPLFLWRILVHR